MNDTLARHTIRNYVCACCWGRLDECFVDGEYIVRCVNPDCDGKGFVTKHYAERRLQESAAEAGEVRRMLQDAHVIANPNAGKTQEQLIKELGF